MRERMPCGSGLSGLHDLPITSRSLITISGYGAICHQITIADCQLPPPVDSSSVDCRYELLSALIAVSKFILESLMHAVTSRLQQDMSYRTRAV